MWVPKQNPQISIPNLSTFTATPQATVSTDLFDSTPNVSPSFGLELKLVTPTETIIKTNFLFLATTEKNAITTGGTLSRNLTLD